MTQKSIKPIFEKLSNPSISYDGVTLREQNMFGKKLAEARIASKISQKKLSEQLSDCHIFVSAGAISKWERGDAMPNPYQLFALCYILKIQDVLAYFTGSVPESYDYTPNLDQKGLNLLQLFKEALVFSGQYTPRSRRMADSEPEPEISMKVFDEPAAAGPGNPITSGTYEMVDFPASAVPNATKFGIRVSGISMLPRYADNQIVWVEPCPELFNGEIGVFYYDDNAYIKKYVVERPEADEAEDDTDSDGCIMPKITLMSLNRNCADLDVKVKPDHSFYIVGRVLN